MGGTPEGEVWAVGQYFTGSETSTITVRLAPVQAAAAFRNAGPNPASYQADAPVLAGTFEATVDLGGSGHTQALVIGFESPLSVALGAGQTLLVNVADPRR